MRFFKSVFFHLSVIFALSVCPAQAKISEVNYSKAGFPGKIAAYELNDELYLSAAQVVRVFGGKINWFGKSSKVQLSMKVNCSQGIAGLTYGYDKAVGSLKQNESRTVTVDFETDYGFKKRDITLEFSPLADGPYKPAGKAFVLFGGGHKCVAAKKIYKKK